MENRKVLKMIPSSPVSYPSPVLQDSSGFAPVRTPKEGPGVMGKGWINIWLGLLWELPKTMSPTISLDQFVYW